ncbi:CrcB protein [Kineosphaera limosa]|uniref:Fluoride-specific ion channel FluC n=1 Tax=Kineosphaera limosa NBRC 100340 TaxID=1184609 RepID=K6WUH3_9MICO|nr:camphor resistance protein CrcB [Kineosphaera limosa]NYE00084.1 CrcB protein [Kineosphaera limosa]GAB95742.1 protein CrcB homolog [Kineosphaera limosa NBRC 100340]
MSQRPHRDPLLLALVAVGGGVGTAVRAVAEERFAAPAGSWPWATFAINLSGAFALALLLESLARRGPDVGRRRAVRLGVGTGVLGGFTTYSTFAVETGHLGWPLGPAYAVATVLLGLLAAAAGLWLSRALPTPTRAASPHRGPEPEPR